MKQNATVSGSQRFQIREIRIILPEQDQNYFSLEPVPNLVGWVKSINKIGTGMKGEKEDGHWTATAIPCPSIQYTEYRKIKYHLPIFCLCDFSAFY